MGMVKCTAGTGTRCPICEAIAVVEAREELARFKKEMEMRVTGKPALLLPSPKEEV